MRKQDYVVIWPAYFDSSKSRQEGRRVSASHSTSSPKAAEIAEAAEKLGFTCKTNLGVCYPKHPWLETGIILAKKKDKKGKMIRSIARKLASSRSVRKEG